MLDNAALKDLLGKKVVTPAARREAVAYLAATFDMSERRACRGGGVDRPNASHEVPKNTRTVSVPQEK
ncbi:hypothetical protein LKMONMHP_4269 [Methylobacterium organophilum]|uniref:Transposase n=1 Tax=Methylobacterium organophilum TaxID=410 RepID=A0ABQ4TCQ7_METOR|nr:hypothetical protein LKMONMHP_4269 [Methylobacterium organophilum]